MATNQQSRFIEIKTSSSSQGLRLRSFTGSEQMSRLFSYQLDVVDVANELTREEIIGDLVGQAATIRLDLDEGERFFNGIISRVRTDYQEDGGTIYRAEMVPRLWLLTRRSNCRIFQDQSPVDIINTILGEHSVTVEDSLNSGDYPTREYCVQYRETDFNFVSRLMEQYGIGYFFTHEDGDHKMHLFDKVDHYVDLPESNVSYYLSQQSGGRYKDFITSWEHQYQFVSGKWSQTDYNFKTPSTSLMNEVPKAIDLATPESLEIYDYPGEYEEAGQGGTETKVRMEEEEVRYDQVSGVSTCRTFGVGGKFTIDEHPSDLERGKQYVITSIQHSAVDPSAARGAVAEYSNTFSCIPATTIFRPARLTPKPLVSGLQTAVVVGPSGEEIYTDDYGRIKVSFFWDREGQDDGTDSIWVRVSHQVAGKKWGFFSIPRIGQEVVVDFLEGDPDRPLCVGGVYNQEQMPHYALPDNMTKTYIKTNSTKGGEGFNELCFEDLADNERIFMHAQKNMDVRVLNDSKENINGHRHQIIGTSESAESGDQTEFLYGNKQQTVKKHHLEWIQGSKAEKIGGG